MKSFTIAKNDAGQRLDKFITKAVPLLPQGLMYKYIRTKRIKVNSKRSEISYKLVEGDTVDMYINDEFFAPAKSISTSSRLQRSSISSMRMRISCCSTKRSACSLTRTTRKYNDTLITRVKAISMRKANTTRGTSNSPSPRRSSTASTVTPAA